MRAALIVLFVFASAISSHAEDESSHRSAATEYLVLSGVEQNMAGMAPLMSNVIVTSNPTFQPYRSVIEDWASKTMTWKNFESRFVSAYVEAFSEPELREMIAFYKTPAGQKLVKLQPALMQKGNQFGTEVAKEHQDELKAMIEGRKAEIEALNSRGGSEKLPHNQPMQTDEP